MCRIVLLAKVRQLFTRRQLFVQSHVTCRDTSGNYEMVASYPELSCSYLFICRYLHIIHKSEVGVRTAVDTMLEKRRLVINNILLFGDIHFHTPHPQYND